ncbi:MAG: hypothetical protein A2170_04860 [Deltaproteobacteria bacterium RBG_13_53_10]|nr:MAG: hypothetical protein A2170_04860 [Deltaproteobacteria bacterium RBG_13_53_10]
MLANITKLMIVIAIASWAISSSSLQDCRVFSTSEVIGADKSAGPALKAGQKHLIGDEYYFVYNFDKRPQMGTIIMKIQVFTKDGKQDTSLEITGDTDMPSMKGAHSTGNQLFKMNKKGDYLLPVNVVMPGDWEVVLNFLKDKKPIYTGSVRFNV